MLCIQHCIVGDHGGIGFLWRSTIYNRVEIGARAQADVYLSQLH